MVNALFTKLKRPCPKPNVYHMTCGIISTLCRTHHSAEVARQILDDGGLDRVFELMKELLDDDFMQLTFLRLICTLSQIVDTKEDTSRCLEILPTVMDRHATSPAIYYNACLAIAAQFGQGCRWSKDIARSICSSLANGIVLYEEKNRKACVIGKDLLENIIGEQNANMFIAQKKEQLQLCQEGTGQQNEDQARMVGRRNVEAVPSKTSALEE